MSKKLDHALLEAENLQKRIRFQTLGGSAINILVEMFLKVPVIAILHDYEGKFHILNNQWEQIFGWEHDEMVGKTFFEFIHPDDILRTKNAYAQAIERRMELGAYFYNRYRCKDGSYKWLRWEPYQPTQDDKYGISFAIHVDGPPPTYSMS